MEKCLRCEGCCIKAGRQKNGTQKLYCKKCKKYSQSRYTSPAFDQACNKQIVSLLIEGIALRGIARILKITLKTVIRRIKRMAKTLRQPYFFLHKGIYEIDELWTYVGKKENDVWIAYSIERKSKAVIDFQVGARTKANLQIITQTVLSSEPKNVCTDGLKVYRALIPADLHKVGLPHTRRIERFNLNLRTHLKRLSRKTICFSKSKEMLEACLRIYFFRKAWTTG